MTYAEQMQRIIEKFRDSGQPWPATSIEIARWAINKKLWDIHPGKIVRQCADQIAQAMRDEFISDPQGRRIRAKHVAPYPSKNGRSELLWDDIRTASREHMELAFSNRRQQIVMDCRQLKLDLDSYNQNFNSGKPIQGVFDFTDDLSELEIGANRRSAA
jgi:hypothetical protein